MQKVIKDGQRQKTVASCDSLTHWCTRKGKTMRLKPRLVDFSIDRMTRTWKILFFKDGPFPASNSIYFDLFLSFHCTITEKLSRNTDH